jgi:hypothetical protein
MLGIHSYLVSLDLFVTDRTCLVEHVVFPFVPAWTGHVVRMDQGRTVKRILESKLEVEKGEDQE